MAFSFYITTQDISTNYSDLYWNNVVLALKFNGSSIQDGKGHPLTMFGTTTLSTSISKYDGSSVHIPASTSGIKTDISPNFIFSGAVTIETWVYFSSIPGDMYIFDIGGGNNLGVERYQGNLRLVIGNVAYVLATWSPVINNWYHIALTRDSNNIVRLFVDGQQIGANITVSGSIGSSTNYAFLGNTVTTNSWGIDGYLDDFRITKGVARYTSTFTPPTSFVIGTNTASNSFGTVIYGAQHAIGPATNLFDSDNTTTWFSSATNTAITWAGLEYFFPVTVTSFSFKVGGAHTLTSYSIEYYDGTNWIVFYTGVGSWVNGSVVTGTANGVSATKWRLHILTSSNIANQEIISLSFS